MGPSVSPTPRANSFLGVSYLIMTMSRNKRQHQLIFIFIYYSTLPMHFSKTYAQLLSSLPPDLRDNAIEYRQLKKLINQVVQELTSLG